MKDDVLGKVGVETSDFPPKETKMKHALIVASLVLVAGTAAGCGGGAPADASEKDFCSGFEALYAGVGDAEAETSETIKKVQAAAEDMEKTGTPDGISDDERDGFQIFVDAIAEIDEGASIEELQKTGDDLSKDDDAKVDKFFAYADKVCGES